MLTSQMIRSSQLFRTQAERIPQFADYEKTAGERVIPVIVLTPADAD